MELDLMKKNIIQSIFCIVGLFLLSQSFAQNVGLSIVSPQAKLHIKGSDNIPQLIIEANGTQSNTQPLIILRKASGGNLIHLHSDDSTNIFLGVFAGKANVFTGTNGIHNTFLGCLAGSSNTFGRYNTALGSNALYNNTSGFENTACGYESLRSNVGNYNTAVGKSAMYSNTTGQQNTSLGATSLYSNTTGSYNTSVGYKSLYQNTTGYDNVAIGMQALENNTNAFSNTAVGSKALKLNTSFYNTGIGSSALTNNTNGTQNTAVGAFALYTSTSAKKNTAIGFTALYDNTSGSENTSAGFEALRKNITGENNSAFGSNALLNNTTGYFNTAIGDSSLNSNVTGNNNTALGYLANVGSGALNNATAIGSKSTVTSSNSIVLGSIQGVNGATSGTNVGIGTTAPNTSSKLEVASTTQGVLIPRMTSSQRKSIPTPAAGLMVYDLDKLTIYLYDGVKWNPMMFTTTESRLPLFTVKASDGTSNDNFGIAVSLFGDYAVVGSPNHDVGGNTDQGCAYIFHRSAGFWIEEAILVAISGVAGETFGTSVDMGTNSETVIIGAPYATISGNTHQGCAYIFTRNGSTWTQQAKLTASDGAAYDEFGISVSLDGDYAVIGAHFDDDATVLDKGSAYIFNKGAGWYDNQPYQAKLIASNGGSQDRFGSDVSISADYVIIGAPDCDANWIYQGAAYIFNRTGVNWSQQAALFGSTGGEYFGHSVSLDGDYVVVSAYGWDLQKGRVNIYLRSGINWNLQTTITANDGVNGDHFGFDVSISGLFVHVGAPHHGGIGAAYTYKRNGSDWSLIRKSNDEIPQMGEFFGRSVAIHGFNAICGIPYKNSYKGEVQFVNIE
jgi:hypothetical protein